MSYRRDRAFAIASLDERVCADVQLPGPAIYDSHDPTINPQPPLPGPTRLAWYQSMLLHSEARLA